MSCLLRKIHRILSQESDRIVAWSGCGKHFAVHDAARFEASILPTYFRLRTLGEFSALLCQHGFTCSSDDLSFSHSDLSRDCPLPLTPKKRANGKVLSKATKTRHHPYSSSTTTTMTGFRGGDDLWSALAAVCLQTPETSTTNPLFQKHTSFETQPDAWQLLNGHSVVCV